MRAGYIHALGVGMEQLSLHRTMRRQWYQAIECFF